MSDNPYILKPLHGCRLVVGDIHGRVNTFKTLVLDKMELNKQGQLFRFYGNNPPVAGMGHLCGLDLDQSELFIQDYMD